MMKIKAITAILFFSLLILFGSFRLYDHFKCHITVKFLESGPLYKNMPVYFKGYLIGRTQEVNISDDYKYTLVKVLIYPKSPKLPKEVEAIVKNHDVIKNYIDLIAPEEQSGIILENGDTIDGEAIFDVGSFLYEIADSGLLIPLIQNISETALNLNKTSGEIGKFFTDSRVILKDNKQNLKDTTTALTRISSKIDTSLSEEKLEKTTSSISQSASNIESVTKNAQNITQNIDNATKNLDKTIEKIDSTFFNANETAKNTKIITGGFCKTLNKNFGGFRLFFGKPLNKNCSCGCAKK